jgi:hypothetical protein
MHHDRRVLPGLDGDRLGYEHRRRLAELPTRDLDHVDRQPTRLPGLPDGLGHGDVGRGVEVDADRSEIGQQLGHMPLDLVLVAHRGGAQRVHDERLEDHPIRPGEEHVTLPLRGGAAARLLLGGPLLPVASTHGWKCRAGVRQFRRGAPQRT